MALSSVLTNNQHNHIIPQYETDKATKAFPSRFQRQETLRPIKRQNLEGSYCRYERRSGFIRCENVGAQTGGRQMAIAYKLFKKRKDGSLGSLFVDASRKLPLAEWMPAVNHKPKTLKERKGWHALKRPVAPHLSKRGRVWCLVEVEDFTEIERPESQGGCWLLANQLKIIREL